MAFDALYRMVLARGLKVTTDLDHLDRRPVPGWRIRIDDAAMVTLEWPGSWPLLMDAPLNLPPGWLRAAGGGLVVVFVGDGLGLHKHATATTPPSGCARSPRPARWHAVRCRSLTWAGCVPAPGRASTHPATT